MYTSIFYGTLYLITLAFIGFKLLDIYVIPDSTNIDIYSFLQIINYGSFYLYFTSFFKLLRRYADMDLLNWYKLKIIYCIYNSYIITSIISYITYQICNCYKNDCLNNDEYIYDIFGIALGLIFMIQLLIHLIIPIYRLKHNNNVENQDLNNHYRKLRMLHILFNAFMFYNFTIILHIPIDISYLIYYVNLYFTMIIMYSSFQVTNIKSLFNIFLLIFVQILFLNNIILNIFVIAFTSIPNIYANINLGFSLILLCVYIFINIYYLIDKYVYSNNNMRYMNIN